MSWQSSMRWQPQTWAWNQPTGRRGSCRGVCPVSNPVSSGLSADFSTGKVQVVCCTLVMSVVAQQQHAYLLLCNNFIFTQ